MVKDSELLADYDMYWGTWIGEDSSELIVGMNGSGEVRFELYDSEESLTASGYVQLVQEYSADYFYNEHDGWAHHCWMDEADAVSIIEIREDGSWSLSERPDGDGDPTEVDSGTLQVNERGDDQYFAVSDQFDDVFYAMTVVEPGAMYWGLENDYYERMK